MYACGVMPGTTPRKQQPPHLPIARDEVDAPQVTPETPTGRPPAPDPRPPPIEHRDPRGVRSQDAAERILKQAVQEAETARLNAEAKAAQATADLEEERRKSRVAIDSEPAPSIKSWKILAFKILSPFGAAGVIITGWLSVHTSTTLPQQVDNNAAKTQVVASSQSVDHELLNELRVYARARAEYDDCVNIQLASAARRGTGHSVTALPDPGVQWVEQQKPKTRPPVLWDSSVWFTLAPPCVAPKPP